MWSFQVSSSSTILKSCMIIHFELETDVLNPLQQTLSSVSLREPVPAAVADALDKSSWAEGRVGWMCNLLAVTDNMET